MQPLKKISAIIIALAALNCGQALAESNPLHFEPGLTQWFNTGSGNLAPYYMMSNRYGEVTQRNTYLASFSLGEYHRTSRHFQWRWGVELDMASQSATAYERYHTATSSWATHKVTPRWVWLQQAFVTAAFRSVFVTAGLKETGSALLNDQLSSGDITWGANARPMPGLRAGFLRFLDVPFTNGWFQINAELFIGKPLDNDWLKRHYNYYNSFITTGRWNSYRRLYFRLNPAKSIQITFGMQAASQVGGTQRTYQDGKLTRTDRQPINFQSFIDMLIPRTGDSYYVGNHLGSWDFMASYRFPCGDQIKAYFQWPWEDGSGVGKLNGWDGLWGLEYKSSKKSIVSGAVVEYIDFTNQSGPLHWDPVDNTNTNLTGEATGADDYYNNYYYNGYAYYGMSQGTPMLPSTIYNTDGYMRFVDTRIKGFHAALTGNLSKTVSYKAMGSWRRSLGSAFIQRIKPAEATCWMVECNYNPDNDDILTLTAQFGMDHGRLLGNNVGFGFGLRLHL
ncbi:MAG: capsule assembly Wzi family protein [Muribaculum sp.]|nr:capsule assembly Wzi family protein [Muribaculaceae bacterium]MCM1081183.1 capsule assembly Wzi family protein [Muribaculum sp.]